MAKGANTRGPYAARACSVCRFKKTKCDGQQPVCSYCASSGREKDCCWERDSDARKPRTDAHFEALRKRADSLQNYVEILQGMLAKCVCQDVSSSLRCLSNEEETGSGDESTLNPDELAITQELTFPTNCLKYDYKLGGLILRRFTGLRQFDESPQVSYVSPVEPRNSSPPYILLVNDVHGLEPEVDWSRYLPPQVALDRREHDKILDLAFKFLASSSLRIIPTLFLRDMHRALSSPRSREPPKTSNYSPMLHNTLLAISAVYSDNPYIRDRRTRRYFINVALDHLQAECRRPNLSLVQALSFFGTYYIDCGDHVLGDMFCGKPVRASENPHLNVVAMSSRASMALGLDLDATAWAQTGFITEDEMHARHWACWSTFALDLCCSLRFGRDPCGLSCRNIPKPFVDEDIDRTLWTHPSSAVPIQPNLLTLTFSESASLFLTLREIVDKLHEMDKGRIQDHATKLDLQLNHWKSCLPSQLQVTLANMAQSTPQKLMLHCQYWWSSIILHRPFFKLQPHTTTNRADRDIDHAKLCKNAAKSILDLVSTWSSLYTLRYTPPTLVQPVFDAGTIFLLLSLQAATRPARVAMDALQKAIERAETCVRLLREMGGTWASARQAGDALCGLMTEGVGPIVTKRIAAGGVPLGIMSALGDRANMEEEEVDNWEDELPPYTRHWREFPAWIWTSPVSHFLHCMIRGITL
ncbi:hypothetical protein FB45DRAFT_1056102 [Roridomyces roridus]|uniref:Zn(2)-C6 fungal-type domain-containing protein n=1 Tax=Roridomyces roridus TaxID=1738132 RepID=A0AAD7FQA8_9AGAR|nr:hypothetical protein FB45DRAFT_1056102 [Roridomyces roridus]